MYWRIAAGFIAFLALTLVAQVALFLWLSTARDEIMPPRLLADLAVLVADELSADAARDPDKDLGTLARARFEELGRPAVLLFPDGRLVSADGREPPEPMLRATATRLRRFGDIPGAWTLPQRRPGQRGRPGAPAGFGPGGAPRGGGPASAWAAAPVHAGDKVVAAVLVARRPAGSVARELAPWLTAGFGILLLAGTALASLAVFKPAHSRLRDLEDAARRFGEGDRTARASERGGDEVAAVARAFNLMADEAAARETALVDADRARRQLLADVSHELRTPLTSIRGYAETLALPAFSPADAQGRHAVHVVGVEVQRLERLVNDLLDLARFDAGGAPFEQGPVAIGALFTRVIERHGPTAVAGGVALDTRLGPGAEAVRGDARRLEQALQNLTANALRHVSRDGHVTLESLRDGGHVVLRVQDDGEGIAAEHLPHIFDRFYKADAARADGGTGLGLSIVKAIVERHGGTVHVRSTPGVQTSIDVRLPA